MPEPAQIVRFRQKRRDAHRRNPDRSFGLGVGIIACMSFVLVVFGALLAYANLTADLPSLERIPALIEPPNGVWLQPTRLYDRSGEYVIQTLENPAAAGKRYLQVDYDGNSSDSLADDLVNATVASLDPTFWEHQGNLWDIVRDSGQESLAQRLVADMLLPDEPASFRYDFRLRLLALQLVSQYGRAKILEWYLNSACYGPLVYGADAAARVYFGKSATQLTLGESAWLVAASETPGINPLLIQESITDRQRQIIAQMLTQGVITSDEARQALEQALGLIPPVEENNIFQAFTELVLEQLAVALPDLPVARGGLRIITTVDYDLQLQAGCVLETQLYRMAGSPDDVLTVDGGACDAARLLPTISMQGDVFPDVAGNVLILDSDNAQVLGMVGWSQSGLASASLARYPAGTLLTPFIYLNAFVHGFSPATLAWDVPGANQLNDLTSSDILEDGLVGIDPTYHGPVRLRTALVNDYLGVADQFYTRMGAENTWETAWQFGVESLGQGSAGLDGFIDFLNSEVDLLESVHAFSVFNNLGLQTGQVLEENGTPDRLSPVAVIRVEDLAGQIQLDWGHAQDLPIVSPQLAYLMTNVLSDEIARWPSLGHPNPLEIGRPAGAKLGVSLDGYQTWVVGFTPQVVVGTRLGTPEEAEKGAPPLAAAALWNAVIKYATQGLAVEVWDPPTGITNLSVCDPSGLLPTSACPTVVNEVFISGNEPRQIDNLYQVMRINQEAGKLATVFTPPELVETQVFLVVPSWAVPWAEQAGLPVPPAGYDPIYLPSATSADVNLTTPVMFAQLSGKIELRGSATGDNFSYYRLQIGQGLNPQEWLLIGADETRPVRDGYLGTWDTQGLHGLYVIQLLVVHTDQTVESAVVQVTVDNEPPQVEIMDPTNGEEFSAGMVENILMQAAVSDDLDVERVEFYLDGVLSFTLWQSPYAGMWPASPGVHTLLARAYDQAGNTNEQMVTFEVTR